MTMTAEQQSELTRQLAQVRDELRSARANFQRLEREIKKGDDQKARVQSTIDQLLAELTELNSARPEVASYLPHDHEVLAWQDEYTAVEGRLTKARASREKIVAGMPSRLEAVKLAGHIAALERSETNLLTRLKGESVGELAGGVYRC